MTDDEIAAVRAMFPDVDVTILPHCPFTGIGIISAERSGKKFIRGWGSVLTAQTLEEAAAELRARLDAGLRGDEFRKAVEAVRDDMLESMGRYGTAYRDWIKPLSDALGDTDERMLEYYKRHDDRIAMKYGWFTGKCPEN